MIDEENLKKHIKQKCYEVKHMETSYQFRKKDLLATIEKYKQGIVGDSVLSNRAILSKEAYDIYEELRCQTSQLCYALGSDYIDIYKRIIGED